MAPPGVTGAMLRRARGALLAAVLLAGGAAAYPVEIQAAVDAQLSLRSSLLAAGELEARSSGGAFGSPAVDRLGFGTDLHIYYCPDRAGQVSLTCPDGRAEDEFTRARIRLISGGAVVLPLEDANVTLAAAAGAAALGGANLTLNQANVGPGVFVGGPSNLTAEASSYVLRPLARDAALEIRSAQGHRVLNGTKYTLRITGSDGAFMEGEMMFLQLRQNGTLEIRHAPLEVAEASLALEDLYLHLRAIVPAESADRRADLVRAFGPFQVVPALLNGVAAAPHNLTLGGVKEPRFALVRVERMTLTQDEANWTGVGEALYVVQGDQIARAPGALPGVPLLFAAIVAGLALAGRLFTIRVTASKRDRRFGRAIRTLEAVLLLVLAAWTVGAVLGVNLFTDWDLLSGRSRAQLALLVAGVAALAFVLVGSSMQSLARSVYAARGRPDAIVVPAAVGTASAAIYLAVARYGLLSLVAAVVRL